MSSTFIAAALNGTHRDGSTTSETVQILDANTGVVIVGLSGHVGAVNCVRFSPGDRDIVASAGHDGVVRLWSISEKACVRVLHGHQSSVWNICFAPLQPSILASGSMDKTVRLWSVTTGSCKGVIENFEAAVMGLGFSCKSPALMTGSFKANPHHDWTLRLYRAVGGPKWKSSIHLDQPLCVRRAVWTMFLVGVRWRPPIGPSSQPMCIPTDVLHLILQHLHALDYASVIGAERQRRKQIAPNACTVQ